MDARTININTDYYLVSNKKLDRSHSFFSMHQQTLERSFQIGSGAYGGVFETQYTEKIKGTSWVVKKFDFKAYEETCRLKYNPYLKYIEEQVKLDVEFNQVDILESYQRECILFQRVYGPGSAKLFYNENNKYEIRFVMLKLEGETFDKPYFGDALKFLSIWIKLLIETYFLHQLGIVHLDIRAANIMYNESTQDIRFCDFGISTFENGKIDLNWKPVHNWLHPDYSNNKSGAKFKHDVYSLGKLLGSIHTPWSLRCNADFKSIGNKMTDLQDPIDLENAIKLYINYYNRLEKTPSKQLNFNEEISKRKPLEFKKENVEMKEIDVPEDALRPLELKVEEVFPDAKLIAPPTKPAPVAKSLCATIGKLFALPMQQDATPPSLAESQAVNKPFKFIA